jgi:hypothetical protein
MGAREQFLTDVANRLALPDDVRAGVLAELEAHLDDATEDLIAEGRDPSQAEGEAVARLGSASGLARELARAHRSPGQLFAAAGAGTWTALRDGMLGTLLGWLFVVVGTIAAMATVSAGGRMLGIQVDVGFDSAWNTVLTALGLHIGALFSGAAAVRAAARSGWRLATEVRPWVMAAGAVAWAWITIVSVQEPLNWVSTIVLALVPGSFLAGASFEQLRPPRARVLARILLIVAVLAFGLTAAVGVIGGSGGTQSYQWNETQHGYEMIAPWWQAPGSGDRMLFASEGAGWRAPGLLSVNLDAEDAQSLGRFHGFRLEAWRAPKPTDGWHLEAGQRAPFATAQVTVDGTTLSGAIRFNRTPGVTWAEVVLTGIGPGHQRYLLTSFGPQQTEFHGSVWDWFVALMRR